MKKEFNTNELLIIRKIIKENLKEQKLLKEELEEILHKIECNLNHNILNEK